MDIMDRKLVESFENFIVFPKDGILFRVCFAGMAQTVLQPLSSLLKFPKFTFQCGFGLCVSFTHRSSLSGAPFSTYFSAPCPEVSGAVPISSGN
jgi:hypothetical protein